MRSQLDRSAGLASGLGTLVRSRPASESGPSWQLAQARSSRAETAAGGGWLSPAFAGRLPTAPTWRRPARIKTAGSSRVITDDALRTAGNLANRGLFGPSRRKVATCQSMHRNERGRGVSGQREDTGRRGPGSSTNLVRGGRFATNAREVPGRPCWRGRSAARFGATFAHPPFGLP